MEVVDWYKRSFIFIITCLHTLRIAVGEEVVHLPIEGASHTVNIAAIQSELRSVLEETDIPDGIAEVIGALESALHLLNCLPLHKSGNCYHPNDYCEIDVKDFTLQAKLTICKNPWTLRIDFKLPQDLKKRIPGVFRRFAFINVEPIVLTLDNNNADGVTTIASNSRIATAGLNIFGFSINAAKAYFNFNLFIRWDCTRPSDNNMKRLQYNTAYNDGKPGNDMNKLYYKLKIDYEIKTKRFPCFCYKCKRCETIVEKQDHFAEGPEACKSGFIHLTFNTGSFQISKAYFCSGGAKPVTSDLYFTFINPEEESDYYLKVVVQGEETDFMVVATSSEVNKAEIDWSEWNTRTCTFFMGVSFFPNLCRTIHPRTPVPWEYLQNLEIQ